MGPRGGEQTRAAALGSGLASQRVTWRGAAQAEMAWLQRYQGPLCDFLAVSPSSAP